MPRSTSCCVALLFCTCCASSDRRTQDVGRSNLRAPPARDGTPARPTATTVVATEQTANEAADPAHKARDAQPSAQHQPSLLHADRKCTTSGASARFAIRWTKELELISLTDLDRTFYANDSSRFGALELAGTTVQPSSCPERAQWRLRGFTPATTQDLDADDAAKVRCEALKLLAQACASRASYVRDLPWDARLVRLLPPAIASALSPEEERTREAAMNTGQSFAQYDPSAKVKRARGDAHLEIAESARSGIIYIDPRAWADVDQDGFEDLLLSVTNADAAGPMTTRRLMVVTRQGRREQLRLIAPL